MASALLKFTQGINVADGQALADGVIGTVVTVENSDDTDVDGWHFELVEVPPGSALLTGSGSITSSYAFTPDVPGTYRLRLTVTPTGDGTVDIRNVLVPFPRRGILVPPYQGFPLPLPLPQTNDPNAKPDELNILGQARGWMGDLDRPLLYGALRLLDNVALPLADQVWVSSATITDPTQRNGSPDIPFATCVEAIAALPSGGVIRLSPGEDHSIETIDIGAFNYVFAGPGRQFIIPPALNFVDTGNVHFSDADITGAIGGTVGGIFADRTQFDIPFNCTFLQAKSCAVNGSFNSSAAPVLLDCDIGGNVSTDDTACTILRSRFITNVVITFNGDLGVLTVDEPTLYSMLANGVTISNGSVLMTPNYGSVWTAYSPAIGGADPGTTGGFESYYRFVGDTCQTRHILVFNGTGATLSNLFIPLPLSLLVDETKLQFDYQTMAYIAGRDSGGSPLTLPNTMATWSGGSPEGLTLDDIFGSDFLVLKPKRIAVHLDMPFKIS